jgi:hypothetical protein
MSVTLYIMVEGDTEEEFTNSVLAPHLFAYDVYAKPSKVITRGKRGKPNKFSGGGCTYAAWRRDLDIWIKQQRHRKDVWFSTLLDYYGLNSYTDDFPGFKEAMKLSEVDDRIRCIEDHWKKDINFPRFIPHLQKHEFEAMLLVNVRVFKEIFPDQENSVISLAHDIQDLGKPPEEINDGVNSAPSKRIIHRLESYRTRKSFAGPLAAAKIGLPEIRKTCRHFDRWLGELESLR